MPTSRVEHFAPGEVIDVRSHLRNRKLAKYFNRETAAAIVCASKLLEGRSLDPSTPFHYAMATVEFEDYGLDGLRSASRDREGRMDDHAFVSHAVSAISPLTQFKVLYNMPLCFVAIEHGLRGDSSVHYGVRSRVFEQVALSPWDGPVLVGAGRTTPDGGVTVGMALMHPREADSIEPDASPLDVFAAWGRH